MKKEKYVPPEPT
jgi:hypothetical protein